jgi:general secretion pathway protein K
MTSITTLNFRRQRGIAAITALLVVTIATILAVELVWELNLNIRRTEHLFLRDQAMQIALGAEIWAMDILHEDLNEGGANSPDHLEETWAQNIPAIPVEGGSVDGFIEDLQGRFNLNNLLTIAGKPDTVVVEQFRRLLTVLDLSPDLAYAVVDWLDADQLPENLGAEDDIYTSLTPPYLAANFWFISTSELMAVQGITPEIFQVLEPHVSALPVSKTARQINVNTATSEVLASLWPGISPEQAETWREEIYYDMPAFTETVKNDVDPSGEPKLEAMLPYLDVGSSYFGLNVTASIGTTRLSMYSLLERSADGAVSPRLRSFDAN